MALRDVQDEVVNRLGERPSLAIVWRAVRQVEDVRGTGQLPQTKYKNCGRSQSLTAVEQKAIVAFMKKWRMKRFCTCKYIAQALKLKVDRKTIANVLVRHGYHWRQLPKIRGLSDTELAKRKAFVDKFGDKTSSWWQSNMNLVLDGVTLTLARKTLVGRQRHMAQNIKSMWMRPGEERDNETHHYNRYGNQLGTKVPLWGGFTGNGQFTLREWTPRPKMTKAEWAKRIPALKRAVLSTGSPRRTVRAKVWQDNEKFLCQPAQYRSAGLQLERFPPNSGDLNPIETVWAWLRRDLSIKEQADHAVGKVLTVQQFRQRAAQLLKRYGEKKPGSEHSRLEKLVRGMPKRLLKCRERRYGRCGK